MKKIVDTLQVWFKKFLHTSVGARFGFYIGIHGFNRIEAIKNGKRCAVGYNYRTNKGADLSASLLTGTSLNSIASPLPPKYIALSTSVLTPAATDTTLTGESVASGLARAAGTIGNYTAATTLDGAVSYTVSKQFQNNSGGTVTINSFALFDASSSGNLFAEANLSAAAVLASADYFTATWTVNL